MENDEKQESIANLLERAAHRCEEELNYWVRLLDAIQCALRTNTKDSLTSLVVGPTDPHLMPSGVLEGILRPIPQTLLEPPPKFKGKVKVKAVALTMGEAILSTLSLAGSDGLAIGKIALDLSQFPQFRHASIDMVRRFLQNSGKVRVTGKTSNTRYHLRTR